MVTRIALSVAVSFAIEAWRVNGRPALRSRAACRYVARADSTAAAMSASRNASPWWPKTGLPNDSRSLALTQI